MLGTPNELDQEKSAISSTETSSSSQHALESTQGESRTIDITCPSKDIQDWDQLRVFDTISPLSPLRPPFDKRVDTQPSTVASSESILSQFYTHKTLPESATANRHSVVSMDIDLSHITTPLNDAFQAPNPSCNSMDAMMSQHSSHPTASLDYSADNAANAQLMLKTETTPASASTPLALPLHIMTSSLSSRTTSDQTSPLGPMSASSCGTETVRDPLPTFSPCIATTNIGSDFEDMMQQFALNMNSNVDSTSSTAVSTPVPSSAPTPTLSQLTHSATVQETQFVTIEEFLKPIESDAQKAITHLDTLLQSSLLSSAPPASSNITLNAISTANESSVFSVTDPIQGASSGNPSQTLSKNENYGDSPMQVSTPLPQSVAAASIPVSAQTPGLSAPTPGVSMDFQSMHLSHTPLPVSLDPSQSVAVSIDTGVVSVPATETVESIEANCNSQTSHSLSFDLAMPQPTTTLPDNLLDKVFASDTCLSHSLELPSVDFPSLPSSSNPELLLTTTLDPSLLHAKPETSSILGISPMQVMSNTSQTSSSSSPSKIESQASFALPNHEFKFRHKAVALLGATSSSEIEVKEEEMSPASSPFCKKRNREKTESEYTVDQLELVEKRIDKMAFEGADSVTSEPESFEKAVFALAEIIKNKMYKCQFTTQTQYGRSRWNLSSGRLSQLLACEPVLRTLQGFTQRPHCEKVCRTLITCAEGDADMLRTIWRKALDTPSSTKITSTLINKLHQAELMILKTKFANSRHPSEVHVEYSIPEDLVAVVTKFFGYSHIKMKITKVLQSVPPPKEAPAFLENYSMDMKSKTEGVKFHLDENTTRLESELESSTDPPCCFLTLLSHRKFSPAEAYLEKMKEEIQKGMYEEALVLIKFDMTQGWTHRLYKQQPTVFLYPLSFTEANIYRRTSFSSAHKKKKTNSASSKFDGSGYCLCYFGDRLSEFYKEFSAFGLAPGLNAPAYTASSS